MEEGHITVCPFFIPGNPAGGISRLSNKAARLVSYVWFGVQASNVRRRQEQRLNE